MGMGNRLIDVQDRIESGESIDIEDALEGLLWHEKERSIKEKAAKNKENKEKGDINETQNIG